MSIDAVGVVIPAHDEEAMLPSCLAALERAVAAVCLPVEVYVVLDSCEDASADIVAGLDWVNAVPCDARSVGVARGAGVAAVLRRFDLLPSERIWLATTDADSRVPGDWLTGQLDLAASGWEVVVGTVTVDDWLDHPPEVAPRWVRQYLPVEDHGHVHGANLGCSASAYLEAGGWQPLERDEDVTLLAAMNHRRVLRTAQLPVITSARRTPRARGGFGDTLRGLAG